MRIVKNPSKESLYDEALDVYAEQMVRQVTERWEKQTRVQKTIWTFRTDWRHQQKSSGCAGNASCSSVL